MKKLIDGILDFRKNVLPSKIDLFSRLANGQAPDALFITCSDSRVAPNWFISTDPGDLFVIRNVGNLIPPGNLDYADSEHSVAAALEFSILNLDVKDVVVCGHSGCGAMHALCGGIENVKSYNLKTWLRFGEPSLWVNHDFTPDENLTEQDKLSQKNVLQQMAHLKTYPMIAEKIKNKKLRLHAWWFEIAKGAVHAFDEKKKQFVLVDETNF
jgi:carbonic anhydrase